jgi:hypothetical protein
MYHEDLDTIKHNDLTPLLDRHHLLVMRSEILPKFPALSEDSRIEHIWEPSESLSAKERAEVNKINAETGKILSEVGAIDGIDERERVTNDKDSGYAGLPEVQQDIDEDGNPDTRNPLAEIAAPQYPQA